MSPVSETRTHSGFERTRTRRQELDLNRKHFLKMAMLHFRIAFGFLSGAWRAWEER